MSCSYLALSLSPAYDVHVKMSAPNIPVVDGVSAPNLCPRSGVYVLYSFVCLSSDNDFVFFFSHLC